MLSAYSSLIYNVGRLGHGHLSHFCLALIVYRPPSLLVQGSEVPSHYLLYLLDLSLKRDSGRPEGLAQFPQNPATVSSQPTISVIIHSTNVYSGLLCAQPHVLYTGEPASIHLLGYDFLLQSTPKGTFPGVQIVLKDGKAGPMEDQGRKHLLRDEERVGGR